jgi:predicted ATPase/DNA-binding SARP family transcriptional activator
MSRLALHLLGPPRFQLDESTVQISRRKVAALLIYLAVTAKAHSREVLIDFFFPKQSRQRARGDFRNTLSILKKSIGGNRVRIDDSIIRLDMEEDLWIDVHEFRTRITDKHLKTLTPRGRIQALTGAVDLYRGEFLSGFYLRDSVGFDEWQFLEQEGLRRDYAHTLQQLVALLEDQGDLETAIEYGRRWLSLDPLEEQVHRQLIRMYAAAGNRTQALRQYEKCREILEKELGEEPEEETEELLRAIRSCSNIRHHKPSYPDHPGNLPIDPKPFVGRETELAQLIEALDRPEVRVLTLTGAGGTGKTRLAVEAAARMVDRFAQGVFFVDLLRARAPREVIPVIARVLDVREPIGHGSNLLTVVKGYLKNRSILLVLDNFEHVCPASTQIAEIVSNSPNLKVLVTSRERPNIERELVKRVLPLDIPNAGDERDYRSLMKVDSVRLFALRAAAANPSFSLTDQDTAAVAEICRHLDGLPLAIELAASRMNVLSAKDLLRMFMNRLAFLQEPSGTRPPRHQTICSAINWSFNLLDEQEKRLFTDLSVFSGGCGFRAIEQVCENPDLDADPGLLNTLASLVDKNLVRQEMEEESSRFSMLETIEQWARARLEQSTQAEQIRDRHADYYLILALEAEPKLHGPDQLRWLDRLERENGNLHTALLRFLNSQRIGKALQLVASLKWFWYRQGRFKEGQSWLEQTLDAAPKAKHQVLQAKAHNALGWMLFIQGNWSAAREQYHQSLQLFHKHGDQTGETVTLSDLGVTERWLGNRPVGDRYCNQAVELARHVGDPLHISLSLIWAYATTEGRFAGFSPRAQLEEAVNISRRLGNLWGVSHGLNGLGDLFRESGKYNEAKPRYEEALRGFRSLRDKWMTAWTLEGLGMTESGLGDFRSASGYLVQGLSLFHDLGDRGDTVYMLARLGMAARTAGEHRLAARILGACQALSGVAVEDTVVGTGRNEEESAKIFSNYEKSYPVEWSAGQVMSFEQAVVYVKSRFEAQ